MKTKFLEQCATVRMLERLLLFTLCTYAASFSALNCASPAEAQARGPQSIAADSRVQSSMYASGTASKRLMGPMENPYVYS